MHCHHCDKQIYVAHICPHCKEYHCPEHHAPNSHNCPNYQLPNQPQTPPKLHPKTISDKLKPSINLETFENKFFTAAFMLVFAEEILRLISYAKNSPFLEPNIYVAITSQFMTPHIASPLIFLAACLALFLAHKFAANNQNTNNEHMTLLKKTVPLGIYTTITLIYAFSTAGWILILLT